MATIIYNPERLWIRAKVAVQPPTVPSVGWLRACLKAGRWQNLGSRVIEGTKVTGYALAGFGYEHLWVDRVTDLPVRLVSSNGQETITIGFRFLPPTPANKALLTPRIPPGFVRHGI
ncbi:MAG TPA: hypothetical protein VFI65_19800 [Streptosporangiaceae bacterium]|nr:hypothetical protein [Streptosporangiaceae bacterium]